VNINRNDVHVMVACGIMFFTMLYLASYEQIIPYDQTILEQKICLYQTMAGMSPGTYNFNVETAIARLSYLGIYFIAHWLMVGLPFYIGSKVYYYTKSRGGKVNKIG